MIERGLTITPKNTDYVFLGAGYDSMTSTFGGRVLEDTSNKHQKQPPRSIRMELRYVSDLTEMRNALSIQANASFSFLGAEADLRASFAHSVNFNSQHVYIVGNVRIEDSSRGLTDLRYTDAATKLLKSGTIQYFNEQYGDMFVKNIVTGSELQVVFELETTSASEQTAVSAELSVKGAGWGVGAGGSFDWGSSAQRVNKRVYALMLGVGGTARLPTDEKGVLYAISEFPRWAAGFGVPLVVVLQSYLGVPLPKGATQPLSRLSYLRAAQQLGVLLERIQTTDNDLKFIQAFPSQFEETSGDWLIEAKREVAKLIVRVQEAARPLFEPPGTGVDLVVTQSEAASFEKQLSQLRAKMPLRRAHTKRVFIALFNSDSSINPQSDVLLDPGYKATCGGGWIEQPGPDYQYGLRSTWPIEKNARRGWSINSYFMFEGYPHPRGTRAIRTAHACVLGLFDSTDDWEVKVFTASAVRSLGGQGYSQMEVEVTVESDFQLIGGGATINGASKTKPVKGGLVGTWPHSDMTWRARAIVSCESSEPVSLTCFAIGLRSKRRIRFDITITKAVGPEGPQSRAQAHLDDSGLQLVGGGAYVLNATTEIPPLLISTVKDEKAAWNADAYSLLENRKIKVEAYALGLRLL